MLRSTITALLLAVTASAAHAGVDEDLLGAVLDNDLPALTTALEGGADADAHGERNATALMLAAERGYLDVMRRLLDAGADPNALRDDGITPLMHATASGDAKVVEMLLAAHADVNARSTTTGITALRVAVSIGSGELARRLLAAGARRDDVDSNGTRLLLTAAGTGSIELIGLFLVPGEDINHKRDADGFTALDMALERQKWNAAQFLIEHGATLAASATGRQDALVKLLELEPVVRPGKPVPLVQTVDLPSVELLRAVLAQGASTSQVDEKGNTLLMLAAKRHHVTALQALLGVGADVNARNADGDTALTIAAGKSEYELIVVGLGLALGQSRESLMRLVFRPAPHSADSPSTARRIEAAKLLLAARADPNATDSSGNTPLIEATRSGDAELVAMLIASGASVNARSSTGNAPLVVAAQFGLQEIASTLIGARADLTVRDGQGRGLVDLAREGGHHDMVQLLERAALN